MFIGKPPPHHLEIHLLIHKHIAKLLFRNWEMFVRWKVCQTIATIFVFSS